MEKPSRGGEKRTAVWASHHEERGSDDVVAPPVCDHRLVPHRWGVVDRCNPSGSAADAGHDATARVRGAVRAAPADLCPASVGLRAGGAAWRCMRGGVGQAPCRWLMALRRDQRWEVIT